MCRYALVDWIWAPFEQDHFDRTSELPRHIGHFDRRTPAILVDFVGFRWTSQWHPTNIGRGKQYVEISQRPLAIIIGDCWPKSCIQLKHNRFLLPSNYLPTKESYSGRLDLLHMELLDTFSVDSDQVIDVMISMLGGTPGTSLGQGTVEIDAAELCHTIEEIHQAGVEGFVAHLPEDRETMGSDGFEAMDGNSDESEVEDYEEIDHWGDY